MRALPLLALSCAGFMASTPAPTTLVETPGPEPGAEQVIAAAQARCPVNLVGQIQWVSGPFVCGNEPRASGCAWPVTSGISLTVSRRATVTASALAYELAHVCLRQGDTAEVQAWSEAVNAAARAAGAP